MMNQPALTLLGTTIGLLGALSSQAFANDKGSEMAGKTYRAKDCGYRSFESENYAKEYLKKHDVKHPEKYVLINKFDKKGSHAILQCRGSDKKQHLVAPDGSEGPATALPSGDLSVPREGIQYDRAQIPPEFPSLL